MFRITTITKRAGMFALAALAAAFTAPTAAPQPALGSAQATTSSDAVSRYLRTHPASASQTAPISDNANTLQITRAIRPATPVSDNASDAVRRYLRTHAATVSEAAPVSDNAYTLQISRALRTATPVSDNADTLLLSRSAATPAQADARPRLHGLDGPVGTVARTTTDAFDWTAASIGAAVAIAGVLLTLTVGFGVARRRRPLAA